MVQRGVLLIVLLMVTNTAVASSWKRLMIADGLIVRVEVVSTQREQSMGRGNRDNLPVGTGMLFVYNRPAERIFWMKRMRIPIDIVWIRKGQIVHIEHRVRPPLPIASDSSLKREGMGFPADAVLELPAGYAGNHSITLGLTVQLER